MKTKTTSDMKTEINFIKIKTTIKSFDVRKGGMLGRDTVLFCISSEADDDSWKGLTHRNDDDFYELRKLMIVNIPYLMVPPLPSR